MGSPAPCSTKRDEVSMCCLLHATRPRLKAPGPIADAAIVAPREASTDGAGLAGRLRGARLRSMQLRVNLLPHAISHRHHLGHDGHGDLGWRVAADVQAHRAVQSGDLLGGELEVLDQASLAALVVEPRSHG